MPHKAKIEWESKGKTPDGNSFATIKQARDYYYYYSRGGQDSVFFILHDKKSDMFALINEAKPPLDERTDSKAMMTTAFGGSIDSTKSLIEIVQEEVKEEAGYIVPLDNIHFVGKTLVSSQMDQIAHGYLVDVTNIPKTEVTEFEKPDATEEFSNNSVEWMHPEDILETEDWKSLFIAVHAAYKDLLDAD